MASADRNDLGPAQEKLEWVTPKISLMQAGMMRGKDPYFQEVTLFNSYFTKNTFSISGPS
jgi:hypothetical protein